MHRHPSLDAVFQRDRFPARAADRHSLSQYGSRGGCAQSNDNARTDNVQLLIEPPAAGRDFRRFRCLMDAPLAASLMLEMLDGIGDIDACPIDLRLLQRPIQQLPRGPTKGRPAMSS